MTAAHETRDLELFNGMVWVILCVVGGRLSETRGQPKQPISVLQMAVSDEQLIEWMAHPDGRVRAASLELITNSYAVSPRILPAIFAAWDQWGPEIAFPDFPLVSHIPIQADRVPECLQRADAMSAGRKLTDRTCRCAGKLVEALSVCDASVFQSHLDEIDRLKQASKVFFRVPILSMRERVAALHRSTSSLALDFEDGQPADVAIALECLMQRGDAIPWLERGFAEWKDDGAPSTLALAVLELASRHAILGYEEPLLGLLQSDHASIADQASIALVRGRAPRTLTLIAEGFSKMGRLGQLRCIDIIRRVRLAKSSNLLRYLLPLGREFVVQDAARIAEVMLFDFDALEEWLEAFLLADDASLKRIAFAIPLAYPIALATVPAEWPRIRHLVHSRLGDDIDLPHPT